MKQRITKVQKIAYQRAHGGPGGPARPECNTEGEETRGFDATLDRTERSDKLRLFASLPVFSRGDVRQVNDSRSLHGSGIDHNALGKRFLGIVMGMRALYSVNMCYTRRIWWDSGAVYSVGWLNATACHKWGACWWVQHLISDHRHGDEASLGIMALRPKIAQVHRDSARTTYR